MDWKKAPNSSLLLKEKPIQYVLPCQLFPPISTAKDEGFGIESI